MGTWVHLPVYPLFVNLSTLRLLNAESAIFKGASFKHIDLKFPNKFPRASFKHTDLKFPNKIESLVQVFSCQFCEIPKNTFFYRTSLVAPSEGFRILKSSNSVSDSELLEKCLDYHQLCCRCCFLHIVIKLKHKTYLSATPLEWWKFQTIC